MLNYMWAGMILIGIVFGAFNGKMPDITNAALDLSLIHIFGVDAVLLSDFVKVKEQETVLDMGTGTGVIPILLSAKTKGKHFTGLEIQEDSVGMARRSVAHNHLEEKIQIVQGDIKEAAEIFKPAFFDVITVNPPYMLDQHGLKNPKDAMAIARHEVLCSLDDILRESRKLLQDKGRFLSLIHI